MTKADVDRWMTELSNRGRWGKDDQLGTLNLITPAKRKQAAALVKEGYPISLAHDVLTEKAVDNTLPFVHTMLPARGSTGFRMDYDELLALLDVCGTLSGYDDSRRITAHTTRFFWASSVPSPCSCYLPTKGASFSLSR
jgi:hypothetical protein